MLPSQILVLVLILGGGAVVFVWLIAGMRRRRAILSDDAGLLEQCVRMLVENEKPGQPYSDRDLSRLLSAEFGMPIRKRDVIRLRRALKIANPDQRHRSG